MKLVLNDATFLKESINIISELVTEATFAIKKDFIELVAMDPGNISMVILRLIPTAFAQYKINEEKSISINLTYFKQILKRSKNEDIITLETEDNKLKITMESSTKRTFQIPLIDLRNEERKIPDLQFPLSIQTSANLFKTSVEDSAVVGDAVTIFTTKDKMIIEANGDLSSAKTEIKNNEGATIIIKEGDEFKAKYSIEYLKKMINGDRLAQDVIIKYNTGYPLRLEYNQMDKVSLAFILAPRKNND